MSEKTIEVNTVIRCIALQESFRKVKVLLIVLMLLEFFVRYFNRYAITILFILIWLVVGPFIIEQLVKKDRTGEYESLLPVLCKKYHYQDKRLKADIFVYSLWLLFVLALLYSNLQSTIAEIYIIYAPIMYITVAFMAIIGIYVGTKSHIKALLANNLL